MTGNTSTPQSTHSWGKTQVYTSCNKDQQGTQARNGMSLFVSDITSNMDYRSGFLGKTGPRQVRTLAGVSKEIGDTEVPRVLYVPEDLIFRQNPKHSSNIDDEGWVPNGKHITSDNNIEWGTDNVHKGRIGKAIIIKGASSEAYAGKDADAMIDTLQKDDGLKYDKDHPEKSDIQVLENNPDKATIENAMKNIQHPDSADSQVMVMYSGATTDNKKALCTHSLNDNDKDNLDKTTFQDYVHKYLDEYGHSNVIISAPYSEEFLQ